MSVIIPCFNEYEYIAECIESVLNQSYHQIQIIVVDDGSTDGSWREIQKFSGRVEAIRTENHGACHARNVGASRAAGDYLIFLDGDDLLGPDVVKGLVRVVEGRTDVIGACNWSFLRQTEDGSWEEDPATPSLETPCDDPLKEWLEGKYMPTSSVLWPAEALKRIGAWDESICVNEDGELMMRGFLAGFEFEMSEVGRAYYRQMEEESSVSARRDEAAFLDRVVVLDKVRNALADRGQLDHYRLPLAGAYYGIVRAHFGTVRSDRLREGARRAAGLAGIEAFPESAMHRLPYRIFGLTGQIWAGKALASARSIAKRMVNG